MQRNTLEKLNRVVVTAMILTFIYLMLLSGLSIFKTYKPLKPINNEAAQN
jgi:hypothetical protein